jgi:divalent metal cation (Fe/Co/Zn/Cd) transporter
MMPQYRFTDPWKDGVRPVIIGLIALAALKGAAALAGGGGILLAQAVFNAAEVVVLASALAALRPSQKRSNNHVVGCSANPAKRQVIICLLGALLIFSAGCALLWGGAITGLPETAAPALFLAILIILFAEVMLWLWISARLNRLRSLTVAAAERSCRRDLLLLIAALSGTFGLRYIPAAALLVSAVIAVFVLLQALELARSTLNSLVEPSLPDRLLKAVRDKAAAVAGIAAVHKIKARPDGPLIAVELWVIVDENCFTRHHPDSVRSAVQDTLKINFRELSQVGVRS